MGAAMDTSTPSGSGRTAPDRFLAVTHEGHQPADRAGRLQPVRGRFARCAKRWRAKARAPSSPIWSNSAGGSARPSIWSSGSWPIATRRSSSPNDRFGHRTDLVRFHPAYHALMRTAITEGLHASPWTEPGPGAHVARAARYYLQAQVEAGHGCPITMTFAAIPSLRLQTGPGGVVGGKDHVARVRPVQRAGGHEKSGVTVGMAMTEKQGGSDVRANTTRAYPVSSPGPGQPYELVGTSSSCRRRCATCFWCWPGPGGLTCFLLPRWRPDGGKNPMQLQTA